MRLPRLLAATVAVCPAVALLAPAAHAAVSPPNPVAGPAATAVTQKVIVVLKDQHGEAPATRAKAAARASADAASQAPVLGELRSHGSTHVVSYRTIDAVAATVSAAERARLAADPAVAAVIPDASVTLANPAVAAANAVRAAGGSGTAALPAGTCSTDPAHPQLTPEALQVTSTNSDQARAKTARSLGFTGKGVTVAYIAEGIDINNPDFIRADGSHVFSDYQDFSGDGLAAPTTGGEAFIDASSIAAQGRHVYDVANYGPTAVTTPCKIRVEGVAPGASLVGLKVFASNSVTTTSDFLQAIDYAVFTDHVDVLNESFGSNLLPDTFNDAVRIFDEQAVAAGTTVTVSSGDAGITNTIGSPADDANVIDVGATTTYQLYLQAGYGGSRLQKPTGFLDDNISGLSSGGVGASGRTVDLVAPGDLNWVLCTPDPDTYADCTNFAGQPTPVLDGGGTSEAAPLTAGAAALVIEAYRSSHAGASPTPAQVKSILVSSADDVSAPADQQGAGRLNSYRAVRAALAAAPRAAGAPAPLLISTGDPGGGDQIQASGAPDTRVSRQVTVTNTGSATTTVSVEPRRLGAYSSLAHTTVTLSDSTSAHSLDWSGATDNVDKVTFTVPRGTDRLNASIAYTEALGSATDYNGRVRLTLFDPSSRFASYDLPQGAGNYGNSQIANPQPGVWTAYIFGKNSVAGGTTGPVKFRAQGAHFTSPGRLTPGSLTLAPGHSGTVTYSAHTPGAPGDSATSLVLTQGDGMVSTVPVLLHSVLPVTAAPQSFRGVLTGGNGRDTTTGQAFFYELDVPSGLPALNASVTLADDPLSTFSAALVDPHGDAVGVAGNTLVGTATDGSPTVAQQLGATAHVLKPAAGAWQLVINFYNQVQGDRLQTPFTVDVDGRATAVRASAPDHTVIPAGGTQTFSVRVHNSTPSTEQYFLDARTNRLVSLPLAVNSATTPLPLDPATGASPGFFVPTDSTALSVAVTAAENVTFDAAYEFDFGDPDLAATSEGHTATLTYAADPIGQGLWSVTPSLFGPYGDNPPASAGTQTTTASVTTQGFDTAVSSPTGDLWQQAYDPSASFAPITVPPGGTVVIPVTVAVAADASVGSTVTGTLYVDDSTGVSEGLLLPNGQQVAAIPYSYTVGAPVS